MSEKYVVKLPSNAVEFRKMLQKNHIVDKDNIFTTNYPFRNMQFAAVVVSGSTSSAKTFWINENSDKAKCAGYYIEKNSPAIAVADINGSLIVGYPVPREKINFWIPEGNILPEVKKNNLNKQLKSISVQVNELKDKNGRLKAGYMFETADIAAKVLSGNMEVDSSIWILDKDCTMKTVEEIDNMRFYGDKPVYHLKQQTKGAVASLYVNDEKKFVLMKGSIVSPLLSKSISPTYKKLYRELFESGRINKHCVVVEDIVFKYSTPPAAVSCGQDMQGTKVWKTLDGECLNPENRSHKKERI
ncbi:MAG: DUF4357 domain-containing protein [Anaerolineaceae bacterium]|nr:DUF4357 domain-containing protein [Anaerolineaceae bacterium]